MQEHRARKRFGQNFLHDQQIIDRIVKAITPKPEHLLVEIGPGQGAITAPLLNATGKLTTIEIDRDLAAILRTKFIDFPDFNLIEMDVLKFDFATLGTTPDSIRVLGNLPYNISTPLLFHLLRYRDLIHDMVFMLQLEVVERLAAQPSTAHYGRLSVMMQYQCKVEKLFKVPPGAFSPQPKVDSAIVRLTPLRPIAREVKNYDVFSTVVRTAFSQRRKTIRNTLKTLLNADDFITLNLDSNLRPENLSVQDYVSIAELVAAN